MTYILYNPQANGGEGKKSLADVTAAIGDRHARAIDITSLAAGDFLADLPGDDRVILCGGDGTIHRLVNDLAGRVPAARVEVWRFGTGNDFVRDVAEPSQESVPLNDYIRDLPVAEAGGQQIRYLNGCSCGVDALVCKLLNEQHAAGRRAGYIGTAIGAIFRKYRPVGGCVTVDGQTRRYEKIWMAAAMNGRFQGGGMKFAPDQDRADGRLCCMVWHGTSALGTLLRFPSVIPGRHERYKKFCDFSFGREITVELDAPVPIQLDGETPFLVSGYTVRKNSQARSSAP